jgi:hypothetical protein
MNKSESAKREHDAYLRGRRVERASCGNKVDIIMNNWLRLLPDGVVRETVKTARTYVVKEMYSEPIEERDTWM